MQYPTGDYNPVVSHGELTSTKGILGRMKRRQEMMPPLTAGQQRVVLDDDGRVVTSGHATAGEKRWGPAHSWYIVDTASRHVSFKFGSIPIAHGALADISLVCNVEILSAEKVVQGRISSLRQPLEPILRELVVSAIEQQSDGQVVASANPRDQLSATRSAAEQKVRAALASKIVESGSALRARVVSVAVAFDAATAGHLTQLQDASTKLSLMSLWRTELAPHLTNPQARALEEIFANPTAENISTVVRRLENNDQQERDAVLHVVDSYINQKMADTPSDALRFLSNLSDTLHGRKAGDRKELEAGSDDEWEPPEDDTWQG